MSTTSPVTPGGSSVARTSTEAGEQSRELAATAASEATNVGRSAQDAAQTVARDLREGMGEVTTELRDQARHMIDETTTQLRTKADDQTASFADRVGQFAEELRALSSGHPDQADTARRYLDQAGAVLADVAGQLRRKDFEGLVGDVQRFARRRPGAFLAATAAAGFAAGRLIRSAKDEVQASPGGEGSSVPMSSSVDKSATQQAALVAGEDARARASS
jgi:hypothetical protein